MCSKVKFTKIEAASALNFAKKDGRKFRREQRYYHCPECNHWHLTSHELIEGKKVKEIELIEKERWEKLLNRYPNC